MSYQASAIGTSTPRICVRRVNPGTAGMSAAKVSELTRILTCTDQLSEPLPQPHQHALQATGAASSILLEFDRRAGTLRPTSACAPGFSADAWTPRPAELQTVYRAFY